MIETVLSDSFRYLLQQGTGWALFILAMLGGSWLLRRLLHNQQRWEVLYHEAQAGREELQERRIDEARETVNVLNQGAASNMKLAGSMDERTQSLNVLIQLVTQMERDIARNNEGWKQMLQPLLQRIENIERAATASLQKIEVLEQQLRERDRFDRSGR